MTDDKLPLNRLHEGVEAQVSELSATGTMRKRLMDIGLIEGTKVECLHRSPAGNPIAYLIRGAVIALRNEDSDHILVSPLA